MRRERRRASGYPHAGCRAYGKRWLVPFAAACSLATPACAADITSIGCVAARLDPAALKAFAAVEGEAIANRPRVAPTEEIRAAILTVSQQCRRENQWSEAAADTAVAFAVASLALQQIEDAMRSDGNDPARAERAFHALPAEERAAFARGGSARDGAFKALNDALAVEHISLDTDQRLHEIGLFASTMVAIERARTAFPAL